MPCSWARSQMSSTMLVAVDRTARHVHGVLEADERGLRTVVHLGTNGRRDGVPRQHAVFAVDHARQHAGKRRQRAHFVVINVAVGLADDFLSGPRLRHHTRQVAHRSGGNEERGFPSEQRGRAFLQPVQRRIFEKYVVADLCLGHRTPHGSRRTGDRVGAQIDCGHDGLMMVEEAEVCRGCARLGTRLQATLGSLRTTIRAGWSSLHSCHQSPLSIHQPFSP